MSTALCAQAFHALARAQASGRRNHYDCDRDQWRRTGTLLSEQVGGSVSLLLPLSSSTVIRPRLSNVTSPAGLQSVFSVAPAGSTPLVAALETIAREKAGSGRQLLIVVITDGEPAGHPRETRDNLRQTLVNITQSGRVHVSFAECTDQADDMEYLDAWDVRRFCAAFVVMADSLCFAAGCDSKVRCIAFVTHLLFVLAYGGSFDNTGTRKCMVCLLDGLCFLDDYREELARVRSVQGAQFKFDFTDFVCKILLATFDRWYFSLDQVKVADTRTGARVMVPMAPVTQGQVWMPPTNGAPASQYYGPPATYGVPQNYTYSIGGVNSGVRSERAACCVIL